MDKKQLKLIVRNLKLLVECLESEIYSDVNAYTDDHGEKNKHFIGDDDDGYPD
jgi:hypothetical protein